MQPFIKISTTILVATSSIETYLLLRQSGNISQSSGGLIFETEWKPCWHLLLYFTQKYVV